MLSSNLFWNIIIFISTIIEWIVFKFIIDKMNDRKKDKLTINISVMIAIISTIILNIIGISPNIKLILGIIIGYLIYIYNYKSNILKGIAINLVYWMILIELDFVSLNFVLITNPTIGINELLKNNIFRLELIFLSKVLLLSIIPIVNSFKYNINLKNREIFNIIIPILSNILSVIVIFTLAMDCENNSNGQKLVLLIVSSILILSNISLVKIIRNIVINNNMKIKNKVIKEKLDIQYQSYLNIQESQLKVRKLYHDINNHITCIKKIYGDNNDVNLYIENIKNELNSWKSIISTQNMILDIIVNEKNNICNKNNIDFNVDINFSKCGFIDMIDVCSIFSNMIDNAIEACMKIDDDKIGRFILIKGTIVNCFFVIKCENSKNNKIKIIKDKLVTEKKDLFLHGLGIKSIKSSVQKYKGEVSIHFSENKFIMQIYIPLK